MQRAARRRRAAFVDSDRWYAELWQKRLAAERAAGHDQPDKPVTQLTAAEIEYWVKKFTTGEAVANKIPSSRPRSATPSVGESTVADRGYWLMIMRQVNPKRRPLAWLPTPRQYRRRAR